MQFLQFYLYCNYILWVFSLRKNENSFGEKYYKQLSYIRELYASEDTLLKNIRNECLLDNRPITINSEEGKFLQFLVKACNVNTIVEVGMLYGYSTVWLARSLPDNGKIYTIDREEYNAKLARKNFDKLENNLGNKIEILLGDAQEKLEYLISKNIQCDMIFIDADKSNYINYLKLSEKLVKKGGLIVADNTFLSGAVYLDYLPERVRITAQKNMREFNKELSNPSKYQSIMLNTEEGLSIALKLF